MASKEHTITNAQLIWTLVSATIGTAILSLPRVLAEEAKQDAWLAVLGGAGLPLLSLILIYGLSLRFPNLTLASYSEKILGKYLGKAVSLLYVSYSIMLTISVINIFAYTVTLIALPTVPLWVINLFMLLACADYAGKGLKVIGRVNELLFYLLLPILPMLLVGLENMKLEHLLPPFQASWLSIFKATQQSVFAYLGFEVLQVLYPFVEKKQSLFKSSLISIAVLVGTYFYVVVITIMFYGPKAVILHVWPVLSLLNAVRVPVIERLEPVFIFFWIAIIFRTAGIQLFVAGYTLSKIFKLSNHGIPVFLLVPLICFASLAFKSLGQIFAFYQLVSYLGIIASIGVPFLLLAMAIILGKREGKAKKNV